MFHAGFAEPLSDDEFGLLAEDARCCRGAVLTATTLAASGHPGGSMSSMDVYTILYRCARLRPAEPDWPDRDRIVVSHGHTAPGVYAALAATGFFPMAEVVANFRRAGSPFEGHVERDVPGVEWSTGNLGQGLSAGVGFALASRLTGRDWRTYVVMSDGEQHKGQVGEARRLAVKYGLTGLTAVVDLNGVQISGRTRDVMPVHVADDFAADGWGVIETDGHDLRALHDAVSAADSEGARPVVVIARTVIGKGVSFMEGRAEFHGRGLGLEEYARAMHELGLDPSALEEARERRMSPVCVSPRREAPTIEVAPGKPRTYATGDLVDCRSAWGAALSDVAAANSGAVVAVLDCDLAESVKTGPFAEARPGAFLQCGVGEHNAATVAGALSLTDTLTFWADFGVFGADETYNQHRLNDINGAAVKLALTHCGLDVGQDGMTHQCLDYVGLLRNLFGWRSIVPADPNQTDRAVRAMAGMRGNVALAMGRSRLGVVAATDGTPAFAEGYEFRYGRIDWLREGEDATLLAMGTVVGAAVSAADTLQGEGTGLRVGCVACPLDLNAEDMRRACETGLIVTAEDHSVRSGLGLSVAEWVAMEGATVRLERLGVGGYRSSGRAEELLAAEGLDAEGIAASVRRALGC